MTEDGLDEEKSWGDSGDFDLVFKSPLLLKKGVENSRGSNRLVGDVQGDVDVCRVLIPGGVEGDDDRDLDLE